MMLMEWLNPAIEKKSWEVVEICERENEAAHLEFADIINYIKTVVPETDAEKICCLERLYYEKSESIRRGYKMGIEQGIQIIRGL
jgi:hypothetical protein